MPSPLLPPLASLSSAPDSLLAFLSLLLEPTPILASLLVPQLLVSFASSSPPSSYLNVLAEGEQLVAQWSQEDKTAFVEGHPRIGEGDVLSELSKKEQGVGGPPTTEKTLDRLKSLNRIYEQTYPRLRYITFVNGRSRAAIAVEMQALLFPGLPTSPDVIPNKILDNSFPRPPVREVGCEEWTAELERAVKDVWKIGGARLGGLEREGA